MTNILASTKSTTKSRTAGLFAFGFGIICLVVAIVDHGFTKRGLRQSAIYAAPFICIGLFYIFRPKTPSPKPPGGQPLC